MPIHRSVRRPNRARPRLRRHPFLDANAEGLNMIRSLPVLAMVALSASAALAEGGPPDGDDARYQFNRVEDGYLRLDLRTGQVSLCSQRPAGWSCLTVPDDRLAFDQEIGRLQNENAALKKTLLDRGVPLPGGVKADPPTAKGGEGEFKQPGNAEIDRMMSVVERVWRRLIEMITNLQRDMMKRT
jgi:hypothetical protein